MFQTTGKLRYSPKLTGDRSEKWWVILDADPEIGRYYRNLFQLSQWNVRKLQSPSWAEHITVVRNEEPADSFKQFWHRYDGAEIVFSYCGDMESDGLYCWLPVECPKLLDIREELGLERNPLYPLHLTIGNIVV
jgi:hypothetical protein